MGAAVNEEGPSGETALMVAAEAGHVHVVKELLAVTPEPIQGAAKLLGKDQQSSAQGYTALHYAVLKAAAAASNDRLGPNAAARPNAPWRPVASCPWREW